MRIGETDAAWIAGFADGEANVGLYRRKGTQAFMPQFQINQTEQGPIDKLTRLVGGYVQKRSPKGNRKDYFIWTMRREEMREFIPQILPYLTCKRRQAEICLEYLEISQQTKNGHWNQEDLSRLESLHEETLRLNRRGRCVLV